MDTLGKRLHVNLIGYTHWFISIRILHLKDHSILVDQDIYATYVFEKYLDTAKIKENSNLHKPTLLHDMIFIKEYASTSDEHSKVWNREYKNYYRACVGSLIYRLSTRVNLCFSVHNLEKCLSNPGKLHFEGWYTC